MKDCHSFFEMQINHKELSIFGVNARDFGAVGDGVTDDASALQAALDSESGMVVVPFGCYMISRSLLIGSNTRLILHPLAKIRLADGAGVHRDVYLITNKNHGTGDCCIEIEGGIWDGNNPKNPRGSESPENYAGIALNFINVKSLRLASLTVMDAESYSIRLGEVRDFVIENITFEAPHIRPNQDGVHIGGFCEDGLVQNIEAIGHGATNDDLVAVNADDVTWRILNVGLKCGPIQRIRIQNLRATDCHTFIRLASVWTPIIDVHISNVTGGCRLYAINADGLRCVTNPPFFDPDDERLSGGVGMLENVHISNLTVHKTCDMHGTFDANYLLSEPLLLLQTRMSNFSIRGFRRDVSLDARTESPSAVIDGIHNSKLTVEGVTERDGRQLREDLPERLKSLQIMQSLSLTPALFRAEFETNPKDRVRLFGDRFDLIVG